MTVKYKIKQLEEKLKTNPKNADVIEIQIRILKMALTASKTRFSQQSGSLNTFGENQKPKAD